MKAILLSTFLFFTLHLKAQKIQSLPAGKYETVIKTNESKWEKGDILLLEGNKYKLSTGAETGECRFSSAAQRLFFLSGPLKGLYAKISLNNDMPAIVLPVAENEQIGCKLSGEIWCYYRN